MMNGRWSDEYLSWGRTPRARQWVLPWSGGPRLADEVPAPMTVLARGLGRSYGDSGLNPDHAVVLTAALDHFLHWDPSTGVLRAEAGVSLRDIANVAVPHGWFLPVTPGTEFVTLGGALAVLQNGSGLMPKLVHTINMPGANKGFQFSPDGKQLIVATNGGAFVYSESAAEQGQAQLLGKLESPGGNGAVQTAMSNDGQYLFVTLQSSTGVAVFNYHQAETSNFQQNGLVGVVPTGLQPVGVDLSPDGQTMYVTSMQKTPPKVEQIGGIGFVSVISVQKAETNPRFAVQQKVTAGCDPVRVIITKDGKTAWVTARESDALLAFDTEKMLSDPEHSLVARVDICSNPIGETFAAKDTRVVAACSNLDQNGDGKPGLAVVNTQAALAGKPALTATVVTGGLPRQFTVRGNALMVTNYGAGQLMAIDVNDLP